MRVRVDEEGLDPDVVAVAERDRVDADSGGRSLVSSVRWMVNDLREVAGTSAGRVSSAETLRIAPEAMRAPASSPKMATRSDRRDWGLGWIVE